jgi:hypothetical protein
MTLLVTFPDLHAPGVTYRAELCQVYLDTFLFDSDDDGIPDLETAFVRSSPVLLRTRWMRNRQAAGERVTLRRRSLPCLIRASVALSLRRRRDRCVA